MTWTPQNNRIPWGLLTPEEQAAMEAAKHGWEWFDYRNGWLKKEHGVWIAGTIYRALPAPVVKPPVDPTIWRFLPKWVTHMAMDADKAWWGFGSKPDIFDTYWNVKRDIHDLDQFVLPTEGFDWRDSLVERPEGM